MTQNPKLGAILCVCLAVGAFIPAGRADAGFWGYKLPNPVLDGSPFDSSYHSAVPKGWLLNRVGPGGQPGQRGSAPGGRAGGVAPDEEE